MHRPWGRIIAATVGIAIAADAACAVILLLLAQSCCANQLDTVEDNQLVVLLYGADPEDIALRLAETQRLMNLNWDVQVCCSGRT